MFIGLSFGDDNKRRESVNIDCSSPLRSVSDSKLSYFLGIQFKFEGNSVKMTQSLYLQKILERFGMQDCKPRKTPCDPNLHFSESDDTIIDVTLYRELIGSLIYAMTCTRPDICWIVSKLSQYLSKPTAEHHAYAKQVLRYIKGTLNYELVFCKSDKPLKVSGYSDSDWAGSLSDRKSVSGYCFMLNSGPVSWKSKKQSTIALSSCEAEYISLTFAVQEGMFLIQLMRDMDFGGDYESFSLKGDNPGKVL